MPRLTSFALAALLLVLLLGSVSLPVRVPAQGELTVLGVLAVIATAILPASPAPRRPRVRKI